MTQSLWYYDLPENYVLSVSKNGWTTDELGIERLHKVFEPTTAPRTIGRYRLLILDGHGSHATAEFDDSAWRRGLFHYICLLIPLIFFSH